jgi:hypothetical protein
MVTSGKNERSILLVWLNLLGWQVEVKQDGDNLVGVARHFAADGSTYRIGASGPTHQELTFQLFEAAMKIVESRGQRFRRSVLAA